MLMCRELVMIASDYIEGQLGTVDTLSVRMHLLMCRHCRSFIGNLRSSIELIRGHTSEPLDKAYAQRLQEGIDRALSAGQDAQPPQ